VIDLPVVAVLGHSLSSTTPAGLDTGDTAWLIVATALVMLMIPGVAFFYGGMVREKNALSTLMLVFASLALISLQWILVGYSLVFGTDVGGFVGGLDHLGLLGVGMAPVHGIPHLLYVTYQGMFAVITVALIVGGIVERIKLSAWLAFALLWATVVYDPIAHWVWGGGWLGQLGALDFAGGTVVHVNSGVAALALVLVLGARKDYGETSLKPHNIPLTVLGAALLWFGWFGFNAGSALAADGVATLAIVTTNTASAAAALTWMALSWWRDAPSALGMASGAVAGLVAITPAAGYVTPLDAIPIGVGAGVVCYAALHLREGLGIDESLDVWAVHGVGGTWGAVATGIFASVGAAGLLAGNPHQLLTQFVGVGATSAYAFVGTVVIAKLVDATIGLRVSEEHEDVGLDSALHGEDAYFWSR